MGDNPGEGDGKVSDNDDDGVCGGAFQQCGKHLRGNNIQLKVEEGSKFGCSLLKLLQGRVMLG